MFVILYCTVIVREQGNEYQTVLIPFGSIKQMMEVDYPSHGQYILKEILINIALLMPVGFFYSLEKFLKAAIIGFGISLCIETLQLATKRGVFEVDDLIYNTIGFVVGWGVVRYHGLRTKKADSR
ncbi:VanZ family protein [uncultured Bacteroides sp.]|uniref:VanZ family protein n=1 Tax=uncultured Bacteroides sp. TaxID=162156 RepID=UPI0025DD6BC0|nr:VanZ family protein [uncultured Bacteroides sp.]